MFTHDLKDFPAIAVIWAGEGRSHAGLIYCSLRPAGELYRWLRHLFEVYSPDELQNVTMALPIN